MEEVSSIFGYFWFGTSDYLHWKLPYCTALFFRTDFTVACVFQKRSTSTIRLPRLEFGRRISCLLKFGTRSLEFKVCTAFLVGPTPIFPYVPALGAVWSKIQEPLTLSHSSLPSNLSLSLLHLRGSPEHDLPPPTSLHLLGVHHCTPGVTRAAAHCRRCHENRPTHHYRCLG